MFLFNFCLCEVIDYGRQYWWKRRYRVTQLAAFCFLLANKFIEQCDKLWLNFQIQAQHWFWRCCCIKLPNPSAALVLTVLLQYSHPSVNWLWNSIATFSVKSGDQDESPISSKVAENFTRKQTVGSNQWYLSCRGKFVFTPLTVGCSACFLCLSQLLLSAHFSCHRFCLCSLSSCHRLQYHRGVDWIFKLAVAK